MPRRTEPTNPQQASGPATGWPTRRRPGRHRHRRPLAGPLPLAAVAAALLVAFGTATALSPADNSHPAPAAPVPAPVTDGNPPQTFGAGATPSPSPRTTGSPTPAPRTAQAVSPDRKTAPESRRTGSTPGTGGTGDSREKQVVTLVNRERAANGCGPVTVNSKLAAASRAHSADQAAHDKMSHTGSDGSTPWERARRAGYDHAIGENVAAGYRTAEAVMTGWMNSPGHRANILNCQARAIGVGVAAAADGTLYWTQMFGSAR